MSLMCTDMCDRTSMSFCLALDGSIQHDQQILPAGDDLGGEWNSMTFGAKFCDKKNSELSGTCSKNQCSPPPTKGLKVAQAPTELVIFSEAQMFGKEGQSQQPTSPTATYYAPRQVIQKGWRRFPLNSPVGGETWLGQKAVVLTTTAEHSQEQNQPSNPAIKFLFGHPVGCFSIFVGVFPGIFPVAPHKNKNKYIYIYTILYYNILYIYFFVGDSSDLPVAPLPQKKISRDTADVLLLSRLPARCLWSKSSPRIFGQSFDGE